MAIGGGRSPVPALIGRRLLALVPVLLGVSVLTFGVLTVLPGSAAQQLLGADATPEQVAQLEAELKIDGPAWQRYLRWLGGILTGDMGNSVASGLAVRDLIAQRLPVTLELVGSALFLSIALAVPIALVGARWPNGIADRLSALVSMIGIATPNYVFALVLVLAFAIHLEMFPSIGFTPVTESVAANLQSMALPAASLALPLLSIYARFLRSDLLEQVHGEEYVVAATAKGIGPWRVLLRHVLRNSLFGLITIVGLNVGTLIGGAVVIEQIFALPGMGQLLLTAITVRDAVVVQAVVLLLALVTVVATLCVDLLYIVLDPRIRYESR